MHTESPTLRRLELDASSARRSLRLDASRDGSAQRIVVGAVAEGSEAWRAGVRPGDAVRGVSDPQRPRHVWALDAGASLRFARDAMRLCAGPLLLDVAVSGEPSGATLPCALAPLRAADPCVACGDPCVSARDPRPTSRCVLFSPLLFFQRPCMAHLLLELAVSGKPVRGRLCHSLAADTSADALAARSFLRLVATALNHNFSAS